jgi:hypothetical protein
MNVQKIIEKCGYGYNNTYDIEVYDQNVINALENLDLENDNACTDVQALLNNSNTSRGSSLNYGDIPPYFDNDLDKSYMRRGNGHHREHYRNNHMYRPIVPCNNVLDYTLTFVIFIIIVCILTFGLFNWSCYPL